MRIGIDLLAAQSPHHGRRGIGRYARGLVSGLVARAEADGDEYVLYRRPSLMDPEIEIAEGAAVVWRDLPDEGRAEAAPQGDRLVRENPDELDAFLVASPFESWAGYLPPSRGDAGRPALAAVLYDVIPFLFPPDRAPLHPDTRRLPHAARAVARYDALLAISDSTRRDAIRYFALDPDRVTTIGTAADEARFASSAPLAAFERDELKALGIDRPYVLCVSGMDPRKNYHGLADAFSRMPEALRRTHQLVVACAVRPEARADAIAVAKSLGIGEALVLTGEVSDATLARLYRGCAVFAFPTLYEGFGLPVLEAMRCGAAVVSADNSSLPEVVGEAGLLAEAADPSAFGAAMTRVLADPRLAAELRAKAVARASEFSWAVVAAKARAALDRAVVQRVPHESGMQVWTRRSRPRIAMVSPLPPRGSGISDYTASLVEELRHEYRIDLFHDGAYTPLPSLADPDLVAADAKLLPRIAAVRDYRAIVYQMGNSRFHQYFYPLMLRLPGVVTLHDFCLAGFHQAYNRLFGVRGDHFVSELEHAHVGRYDDVLPLLKMKPMPTEDVTRACAEQGLWVNRRVFEAAEAVIVHSPWCVERAREQDADLADKAVVVPMGTTLGTISDERKRAIRDRFNLPQDALIVASFGYIHPDKMNVEAVEAFASVARAEPRAIKVFVGAEADGGVAREAAERAGLADHVRFLGRRSSEEFHDLAAITDIGVNLRRPPTNGETSAALLDLLRWGVPTLVTDVATFADYPDAIVAKVRWPDAGIAGLGEIMRSLALGEGRRAALRRAALEAVRRDHQWSNVAGKYAEVIERAAESRARTAMRGAS